MIINYINKNKIKIIIIILIVIIIFIIIKFNINRYNIIEYFNNCKISKCDIGYKLVNNICVSNNISYTFTNMKFTNCGATGIYGPTLSQCKTSYSDNYPWTNNPDYFNMDDDNGIQKWKVSESRIYKFTVAGTGGGTFTDYKGGKYQSRGVIIDVSLFLNKNDIIYIVIGQLGASNDKSKSYYFGIGGGGGTFVYKYDNINTVPLIIAGGGGGGCPNPNTIRYTKNVDSSGVVEASFKQDAKTMFTPR